MTENWPEKHASKHEIHQETQELVVGGLGSRGEYNVFSSTDNLGTVFNAFRCIQCLNFSRIEDLMGRNTKCSLKGQIKIISILCKYFLPWTCAPLSILLCVLRGAPEVKPHSSRLWGACVSWGRDKSIIFTRNHGGDGCEEVVQVSRAMKFTCREGWVLGMYGTMEGSSQETGSPKVKPCWSLREENPAPWEAEQSHPAWWHLRQPCPHQQQKPGELPSPPHPHQAPCHHAVDLQGWRWGAHCTLTLRTWMQPGGAEACPAPGVLVLTQVQCPLHAQGFSCICWHFSSPVFQRFAKLSSDLAERAPWGL